MDRSVDILLARPAARSRRAVVLQLLMIAAWHIIVFTATLVLLDWRLG